MRLFAGIFVIILFICWVIYRLFIKRDLKKHMNDFYLFLFFIFIWVLIYAWLTS